MHGVNTRRHSGNSTQFSPQTAHVLMSAQWLRLQCSRAPETGGSSMSMSMSMSVTVSVRPLWKQGVPSVQTTTTGHRAKLAVKVTPSPCPLKSESVGVGRPEAKQTLCVGVGVGVRL
jgi:hypothetical protein